MREWVKAGFHVITCDLTASASHLLVSAVPRIRITLSKSPFFFEILACISDNYLRLTTAHTQILQHYPHLPLKVVMGSIIIFSLAINIG